MSNGDMKGDILSIRLEYKIWVVSPWHTSLASLAAKME